MAKHTKQSAVHFQTDTVRQIIKHLETAGHKGGVSPFRVFEDFLKITEATLARMPDQLRAAGLRGELADDPPEIREMFQAIDRRYGHNPTVWQQFGQAFARLLAATEDGLWGDSASLYAAGAFGPDVLGAIYQTWGINNPQWNASFYTPYSVASLMAQMTMLNIERQVHDRVKAGLLHADNVIGQALLIGSLALAPDPDKNRAWDYFIHKLVPAAMPYLEPIKVMEPAIGSGVLVLAAAAAAPEWAVKLGLIQFAGADTDMAAVLMARCNCMLYGLNGFHVQLHVAAQEAWEGHTLRQAGHPSPDTLANLRQIWSLLPGNGEKSTPVNVTHLPSTQQMLYATATPVDPVAVTA